MDSRISKLSSPASCEQFARNAEARDRSDLARAVRRRAVELSADEHRATSDAERECLQAVYAYERTLLAKHGKAVRATYTWRMIESDGIIRAVEKAVTKESETAGYKALKSMGLQDLAFEAVVLRHPKEFSEEAVRRSRERLRELD